MQRLYFVATGGTAAQKAKCVYCGPDGDAALAAFDKAASDESNEAVRFYRLPEQTRTATPKRFVVAKA